MNIKELEIDDKQINFTGYIERQWVDLVKNGFLFYHQL